MESRKQEGMSMEWNERIAVVRKAAGLTQEQLGERLGVSRQAVSKWESGQTVPDAVTIAKLCETLHVSADYVLLGREPSDAAASTVEPEVCPLCGQKVYGNACAQCGYIPGLSRDDNGMRYALVTTEPPLQESDYEADLVKYCGMDGAVAHALLEQAREDHRCVILRRDLKKQEVRHLASHMRRIYGLRIVADHGERRGALLAGETAMELPQLESASEKGGIGFWGVVGAVIVALLIVSIF